MSTHQIGDWPPGDDHYFDLEDEETRGAGGGRRNPNAPAWDPEKMDRLLEEKRYCTVYIPPRQVEQAVPHKVKLPPFWEKDAVAWFKLAEAVLEDNCVRDPRFMYRNVILHILDHVLERARGVLCLADTAENPFKELKDRLVELLTPNELDQRTSILWGVELGGRRPTELMEVMLASLPPDEQPGKLFKTVFLHRLPGDLKDLVAVQFQQLGAMELAKFADII